MSTSCTEQQSYEAEGFQLQHFKAMKGFLVQVCWNPNRGSGCLVEERQPQMSPKYDSNMNRKYNNFIDSTPHMSLSATLSNLGHLNYHSRSHRDFQHMTAKVLFHTDPNRNTSMT